MFEHGDFEIPVNYNWLESDRFESLDLYSYGYERDRKSIICRYIDVREETDLVGVITRINSYGLRPAFLEELLSCGEARSQDLDEMEHSIYSNVGGCNEPRPVIVQAVGSVIRMKKDFWRMNSFPHIKKVNGRVVMEVGLYGSQQYWGRFLAVEKS